MEKSLIDIEVDLDLHQELLWYKPEVNEIMHYMVMYRDGEISHSRLRELIGLDLREQNKIKNKIMNYYWLFYLISIVGNLSIALGWIAGVCSLLSLAFWLMGGSEEDCKNNPVKVAAYKKNRKLFFIIAFISWIVFALTPTKKDSLFILAAGTVGNFMTQDSSAKRIPSEIATYLSTELEKQIKENVSGKAVEDMTKEELIEELKNKK